MFKTYWKQFQNDSLVIFTEIETHQEDKNKAKENTTKTKQTNKQIKHNKKLKLNCDILCYNVKNLILIIDTEQGQEEASTEAL